MNEWEEARKCGSAQFPLSLLNLLILTSSFMCMQKHFFNSRFHFRKFLAYAGHEQRIMRGKKRERTWNHHPALHIFTCAVKRSNKNNSSSGWREKWETKINFCYRQHKNSMQFRWGKIYGWHFSGGVGRIWYFHGFSRNGFVLRTMILDSGM